MSIRVRLSFDELVPGYSKKTWFLFDTASCRLVADLEHLIQRKFELQGNSSINLYHEGFLLPTQEKIEVIREGDIIRVEQQSKIPKDKKIVKWNDTSSSKAKKQKLDSDSQKSVNGKKKKKKSNQNLIKHVKNHGRPSETKSTKRAKSNNGKRLQSDEWKGGKPRKGKTVAFKKGKNKAVPLEQYPSKNTAGTSNSSSDSTSSDSTSSSSTSSSEDEISGKNEKPRKGEILQRDCNKAFSSERYAFKNATVLSSSSSETSCTSSSEDEMTGKFSRRGNRVQSGQNKVSGKYPYENTTLITSSSLSSSSQQPSIKYYNKNFKPSHKRKFSSSLSSTSSSTLSSTSSSEESSDDDQIQGLNSMPKDKCLDTNVKDKTNIHPATTVSAKPVKNLPKIFNQSKNDGLNPKTKENVLVQNNKSKTTPGLSGKERNQSNIPEKEPQETQFTNGNSFPAKVK